MGIPGQSGPQTSRVMSEYTVGTKQKFPEQTQAVQIASQAAASLNPNQVTLVWAEHMSETVSVGAQTLGSEVTVQADIGVLGLVSYKVLPGRNLVFVVSPLIGQPIKGLCMESLDAQGLVNNGNFQIGTTDSVFQGGATYSNFIAQVISKFYAVAATSAGTMIVRVGVEIYDIPGPTS